MFLVKALLAFNFKRIDMKSFSKFLMVTLVALAACNQPGGQTELSDQAFAAAMERYLKDDKGPEQIGNAMQAYVKRQQKKAEADQGKRAEQELEAQFKNPVKIDIGDSPSAGPANAAVTVVEFSDFECPFCKRGADTVKEILKAYPKDVRVVFKNLPLPFHKNADSAARAALAAGKQGKFWEMHDALFDNQQGLGEALYMAKAKELGLKVDQFKKDMESDAIKKAVEADKAQAQKAGISGTPGFSVNGVLVKGAYPFAHFKTIIDRWLAQAKK